MSDLHIELAPPPQARIGDVCPPAPSHLAGTGLELDMVVELLTKVLDLHGHMRLPELVARTCLPLPVLEPVLDTMRGARMCEFSRDGGSDADRRVGLSELGRSRAEDFMRRCQYVGPAPVPLDAYIRQVAAQSVRGMTVSMEDMRRAYRGIVVRPGTLERLGAAMNSGRAMFVYGPPGSGKSFLSERLGDVLHGRVAVPYAIVVQREIVQVFDPLVHVESADGASDPAPAPALDLGRQHDRRWVACNRPVVRTGAELTLPMVDLQFDAESRFYQAPPQVKANNGLFILDDLGRQLVKAQTLMNRWIVPLERGVDSLALHTGTKFLMPFDVIVVFSSNLLPSALADEAFLRRLAYKIHLGPLDEDQYREVFRQTALELDIAYVPEAVDALMRTGHTAQEQPLMACVPRDLLRQVRDRARLHGTVPRMDAETLEWAWHNYFVKH